MSYTPLAPNCRQVVEALAHDFPDEFRDCHQPDLGARAWAFIRRVAYVLHTTVDQRFGLNGKRGNVRDPSMDAISFRNPASPAGGVEVYDVVGGAGGANPQPAWIDVTQATANAGTIGAFIQPEPVSGATPVKPTPTPTPTPVPTPTPQPPPCQFKECACGVTSDDIDALFVAIGELQTLVRQMGETVIGHVDDAKGRIERVSQELANKPTTPGCRLRF